MRFVGIIIVWVFLFFGCNFDHDDNTQVPVVNNYYLNFTPSSSILVYKESGANTDHVVIHQSIDSISYNDKYIFALTSQGKFLIIDVDSVKSMEEYSSRSEFDAFLNRLSIKKVPLKKVDNVYF
ncbi:hypothetical protein FAM09_12900 [Niastella caeni]|uniref:Uncharacterized protein n=1 Tax=Niastella caeni TaxID=2569763 RepID=A0A4S8HUT4_9BACT|nr:hypothetical protein [Niastella caeni]THU39398.1 hypothetical protein FAM09_12900 [Niastella caeni]